MKHAGYGRYDVEVNGQVVGRAVKRPEGWEATGAKPGVSVTVHGHDSLESACMAIGRALMGAGRLQAQVTRLCEDALIWKGLHAVALEQQNQLKAQVERLSSALDGMMFYNSETVHVGTPAQSRAEHDAALLREWGVKFHRQAYPKYEDKFGEGHYVAMTNMSRELHLEANRLLEASK